MYGQSQNHETTEWPGLKRTTMLIWFQPPCYEQGRQPPDQAAQSHIQPGFESNLKSTSEKMGKELKKKPHQKRRISLALLSKNFR